MKTVDDLLAANRSWAESLKIADPDFFGPISESQHPEFLWIGCSDSRISPTSSLGLQIGEMFVHRNVANLVNHSDMNCLSAIQFAVEVLKVRHIIVCGHYDCGGVKAAFDDDRLGLVDNWLRPIHDAMYKYNIEVRKEADYRLQLDKLCELNVIEQIVNAGETTFVQDAWERRVELSVHGWIYTITDGLYRDLGVSISGLKELDRLRSKTFDERHSLGFAPVATP